MKTHKEHSEQTQGKYAVPCTAADITFGGRCLNCGYSPEESKYKLSKSEERPAYLSPALRDLFRCAIKRGGPVLLDRNQALAKGLQVTIRDFRQRDGVLELQTPFGWIPARANDVLIDRAGLIPDWRL